MAVCSRNNFYYAQNINYYELENALKVYKVWEKKKFLGWPWTTSIDLTYIDNYRSITNEDFVFQNVGLSQSNQGNSFSMAIDLKYDNSIGKLTVGNYDSQGVNLHSFAYYFDLYVIPGLHNYLP